MRLCFNCCRRVVLYDFLSFGAIVILSERASETEGPNTVEDACDVSGDVSARRL